MSIFRRQFIDNIEWIQTNSNTMVYHYPSYKNDIKYGAKLTVLKGQVAAFVSNNKLADILESGTYQLNSESLPILANIQNWQSGTRNGFKSEIFFFNTNDLLNFKWKTDQPVSLQDEKFGLVRLQAFGNFTTRIDNAGVFLKRLIGNEGQFEISELNKQLSDFIIAALPSVLSNAKISVIELPTNYNNISNAIKSLIGKDFKQYGLILNQIYIENIILPEDIQKQINISIDEYSTNKFDKKNKHNDKNDLAIDKENSSVIDTSTNLTNDFEQINQSLASNQSDSKNSIYIELDNKENSQHDSTEENHEYNIKKEIPKVYYLMIMGERKGPMSVAQISELFNSNNIDIDTLIWHKGLPSWMTIGTIGEFDINALINQKKDNVDS